mmetsp:Transcript_20147/g.39940  ORF Transcript_20147/g.39940 Transcript_20147/m.39940 type:complete len:213 (-) Transcript_20147:2-640(-)
MHRYTTHGRETFLVVVKHLYRHLHLLVDRVGGRVLLQQPSGTKYIGSSARQGENGQLHQVGLHLNVLGCDLWIHGVAVLARKAGRGLLLHHKARENERMGIHVRRQHAFFDRISSQHHSRRLGQGRVNAHVHRRRLFNHGWGGLRVGPVRRVTNGCTFSITADEHVNCSCVETPTGFKFGILDFFHLWGSDILAQGEPQEKQGNQPHRVCSN